MTSPAARHAIADGGRPLEAEQSVLSGGDVVLVTGSTSGIGRETARNLAATGATVLVHGRDRERAAETVAALPGDGHVSYRADFADLGAVRDLAAAVRSDHDRLDCLVNNAGTWQDERRLVDVPGADAGIESTFVVNHLAPFLLTCALLDPLEAAAEARAADAAFDPDPARVVTVSSDVHRQATMDLAAVQGPEGPSGREAYALSKLANVVFTKELARRAPDGVTANCCHPGVSPATALARDGSFAAGAGWRLFGLLGGVLGFTDSPAEAARTQTYLATSPDVADVTGAYFADREQTDPSEAAIDRTAQGDLWRTSLEWTGVDAETADRLRA